MARATNIPTVIVVVVAAMTLILMQSQSSTEAAVFPLVEVTLANDGIKPLWIMCQKPGKGGAFTQLAPNATYRFSFRHIAFPMRWCYIYIDTKRHGFFWAYTVRSKCTKCFWSIEGYPSLYRGDKGRWERQRLFVPTGFNVSNYVPKKQP